MAHRSEKTKQSALLSLVKDLKKSEADLKESEKRYRELFKHMRSGVAVYEAIDGGRNFIFKDFNKAGEKIDRIKKENLIGKRVTEVFPGAEAMGIVKLLRRVWKTGMPVSLSETIYEDDRLGRTWRDYYIYRLPTGEVVAVYADVTGRKKVEDALKESESRYRSLVETMNDGLGIQDRKGRITFVNDKLCKMIGYSKKETIGRNIRAFLDEKNGRMILRQAAKRLKGGRAILPYELEWTRKDGKKIVTLMSPQSILDKDGKTVGSFAVITDITERKKAMEDLERLFHLTTAMVCIANFKGHFTKVSPAFMDTLGYSERELLSKPFIRFVHPDDRASTLAEMGKIVKGKVVYRFMNRYVRKDGSARFLEWTTRPVMEDRILFAIAYDVTERELALEEITKERDKINAIIQSIGDGLFVVDREGRIVLFNKAAEKMSGYRLQEALGKRYSEVIKLISDKDKKSANKAIDSSLRTGDLHTMMDHTVLINKDGDEIPVASSSAPLRGSRGEIFGCVVIFRDVMHEREIDHMKTEFISVATHQLHTPLTGIKWFLELLLAGRAGALLKRQREYLINVHESNERMIRLINDLLNVSRIESGERIPTHKEPVNIMKLFTQTIAENISLARKNRVTVKKRRGVPRSIILPADEGRIRLAISNILNNSIKYSQRGGRVEIGCEEGKNSDVTFWVKDNGVGIPRNQQHHVFEKFFRADNVMTKVTEGTGLGLYIAKSIIEEHDGRIWFESKEGAGTTFYFTIPRNGKKKKAKSVKKASGSRKKKRGARRT